MNVRLTCPHIINNEVRISGSKSETNRLLILRALFPALTLENISDSDDSQVLAAALTSTANHIDIGHAGTAMRFLTAYFAAMDGADVVLTGSHRMQQRPIGPLVDALRKLGVTIDYQNVAGFPPVRIRGKLIDGGIIEVDAHASSQFITALLLIAPVFRNGLEINPSNPTLTSRPYIEMTLFIMRRLGFDCGITDGRIFVKPGMPSSTSPILIESDWSSASYFYAIIALSKPGTAITLSYFFKESIQGDSAMSDWFRHLGVSTRYDDGKITITKEMTELPAVVESWMGDNPDCIPTIVMACFGLGLGCHITGAHTLRIKETDRLAALKNELEKLGAKVHTDDDSITLQTSGFITPNVSVATYGDHRMAMAAAPLALKVPIIIEDAQVVSKSYPAFWRDLASIGFSGVKT